MKKRLLLPFLLIAFLSGHSQVVLNELFTDASTAASKQFFELYNTGTTPVNLDCYTIISYFDEAVTGDNTTNKTGFYIIDLPKVTLAPQALFVAAAGGGAIQSGQVSYTPDLNWNAGTAALTAQGASFKRYERRNGSYAVTDVTGADFLSKHGTTYAVFLFNEGFYTNGFVSGLSAPSTEATPYYGMPQLSNLKNDCGTYSINWLNVSTAEYFNPIAGTDHGYYRGGNGLCGSWSAMAGSDLSGTLLTPGAQNPVGSVTQPASGALSATQYLCGTNLQYTVSLTGEQSPSSLPATVEWYYDNGTIGTLDNSDVLQSGTTMIYESGGTGSFNVSSVPGGQPLLIVYRSSLGCIGAIGVPVAVSGTLQTMQSAQKADASGTSNYPAFVHVNVTQVATGSGTFPADLMPIEARLYIDNDPANNTASDTVYLGSKLFTQATESGVVSDGEQVFDEATQLLDAEDIGKMIYIEYKTGAACITNIASFELAPETALPVHFKSVTATRKDASKVEIVWETVMEQDNRGFHVQRNTGLGWQDVAFVFSQAENGNSTQELRYSFTDNNNSKGVSHYRILQVDLDGKGRYSETRSVRGTSAATNLLLFPNPSTTESVTLLFEDAGTREVVVNDLAGRVVKQYRSVSTGSLLVGPLGNGFYTVQVKNTTTGALSVEKFIIKER